MASDNIGSDGQSNKGYVGIAEESSYASGTAPAAFVDAVSEGFSGDNQPLYLSTIRGRETYKGEAGGYVDDGDIEMPVTPEGTLPYFLKGAFGAASVTDNTDYGVHEFTPADKLPSYSVEVGMAGVVPVRHIGGGVDTLALSHSAGERLTATPSIMASSPEVQTSTASPTYDSLRTFVYHDATISIAGTDRSVDVQDLEVEISNSLELVHRDERTRSKAFTGSREVTATATLDFENDDLFRLFLGSSSATTPQDELAEAAVNPVWTSPETIGSTSKNYELEVDLPRCRIDTHDANMSEQDMVAENVEFTALFDSSAGYEAKAILTNETTTAY